ncbi:sensor histidine kinase [Mucilaginibacter sp.]|jgi:signal transduction histidine kinase|uniref:sensor histidine kinase n=1 Tax=Mucilaginibacter sp. TaxID=1882438 RepID=UPI0035626AE3
MKLVDKLTLWLVGVVFLVTPISMVISYRSIRDNIRTAEIARLQDVTNKVAEQIKAGIPPHKYLLDRPIAIKKISAMPAQNTKASTYRFYNTELKRDECRLDVVSYYKINNQVYSISTYNYIARGELIIEGMMRALIWKMILIIVFVAVSGRLISRYVLSSFQKTLEIIQAFSLRQKEKIVLPVTNTTEFKQLNFFLKKMTDIALEDYSRVKEFSENASHEVQTPLAVIRSKLELLSESNIAENQAVLIDDMQNAVDKLVRINRSLLLLTKLDNFEFEASESILFCKITNEALASFDNWIQMKNLCVTTNIDKKVSLQIHPVLAEILVTNLVSNAIRYNMENGDIDVTLTNNALTIKNTGLPPDVEPELLFRRFKKSNQSAESIGLGLSIVKQICTVNNFKVSYTFANGVHCIQVNFAKVQQISKEPQENTELVFNENIALA